MTISKIEAFLRRDNHVLASSFLTPIYQLALINRPGPWVSVTILLHRLPPLTPESSSSAAAATLIVVIKLGRCITLSPTRGRGDSLWQTCIS